ncbi:Oligosaccharide translocation protein rft1 [Coemansia javaensis]|uniref:Man(5)GlcNAc(2)-PP-dolichol translocation protein RFT1 n=1 Tax=Coemansia javaensis TaxID=2761396 RepID=A0A9W8H8Y8_9FUNG|nr:Oligosaccharide translocation protein rft1 [Coemansia javaensis]
MAREASARGAAARSAFSGAQYLVGLQLFVRLATFATNVAVVYIAGRQAFGVATVRFELLLSTILFLSREGMRSAILRLGDGGQRAAGTPRRADRPAEHDQRIINAALVPIAAGAAMAGVLYAVCVGGHSAALGPGAPATAPHYRLSLAVYIGAACVELCVEPLFVLARARVLFKLQAQCEGAAVACRCAAVVAVLLCGRLVGDGENPLRLLAFAAGQMAYAVAMLAGFAWHMSRELDYPLWTCYVPRPASRGAATGGLAAAFVGQSLLKHVLTQGDSMAMARFATADEMGVFALVTNYGSIPARVLFLPLEEASRAVFSRMAPTAGAPADGEARADALNAARILATLGRLQLLLGAVIVAFGPLHAPLLLSLVRQNDPAVRHAFAAYCLYLPLMGLNGFLEAFVHSVATRPQLVRVNVWMAVFSAAYMACAVYALCRLGLGSAGIIAANMLNMALRIVYCARFVSRWYARRGVAGPRFAAMLPSPAVAAACLASAAATAAAMSAAGPALHPAMLLLLGAALGAAVLATIWRCEQPFIQSVLALRSGRALRTKTE